MKMKKVFAALLSAMLVFAIAACSNGSSGDSEKEKKPGAGTTEVEGTETAGTISSDTVQVSDDTTIIKVDEESYYEFTEIPVTAESNNYFRTAAVVTTKGGLWTYYKKNKPVYSGTYKGDISEVSKIVRASSYENSRGLVLELTITAVADESGDFYAVSADSTDTTFSFEVKASDDSETVFTFEATIPEVKADETKPVDMDDGEESMNITAVSASNGIVITVTVPDGCQQAFFYRQKVESSRNRSTTWLQGNTDNLGDWYAALVEPGTISVIDYFVEKDATYKYWVSCWPLNMSYHKTSKKIKATSTVEGMTPPTLKNVPVGSYESNSQKLLFTTKPEFLNNQSNIPGYEYVKHWFFCESKDSWHTIALPYTPGKSETDTPDSYLWPDHTYKYKSIQISYQNEDRDGFYHFYMGQNARIPDFTVTESESVPDVIDSDTTDGTITINYENEDSSGYRGFKFFYGEYLDGIVHISNPIKLFDTSSITNANSNGVLGYLFNYKQDESSRYSFSIAGVKFNQTNKKIEAYVETYKNVSVEALESGLPTGSHATSDTITWGANDFGFVLKEFTDIPDEMNIWIDVVANDGQTEGRKGAAGTYTVKFFDADPGREDVNNAINYTNTEIQALATLVVAAEDVSNPYSSSIEDMESEFGCYAYVYPRQTLTGSWEFF